MIVSHFLINNGPLCPNNCAGKWSISNYSVWRWLSPVCKKKKARLHRSDRECVCGMTNGSTSLQWAASICRGHQWARMLAADRCPCSCLLGGESPAEGPESEGWKSVREILAWLRNTGFRRTITQWEFQVSWSYLGVFPIHSDPWMIQSVTNERSASETLHPNYWCC